MWQYKERRNRLKNSCFCLSQPIKIKQHIYRKYLYFHRRHIFKYITFTQCTLKSSFELCNKPIFCTITITSFKLCTKNKSTFNIFHNKKSGRGKIHHSKSSFIQKEKRPRHRPGAASAVDTHTTLTDKNHSCCIFQMDTASPGPTKQPSDNDHQL